MIKQNAFNGNGSRGAKLQEIFFRLLRAPLRLLLYHLDIATCLRRPSRPFTFMQCSEEISSFPAQFRGMPRMVEAKAWQ